jgi:hypothetical protein
MHCGTHNARELNSHPYISISVSTPASALAYLCPQFVRAHQIFGLVVSSARRVGARAPRRSVRLSVDHAARTGCCRFVRFGVCLLVVLSCSRRRPGLGQTKNRDPPLPLHSAAGTSMQLENTCIISFAHSRTQSPSLISSWYVLFIYSCLEKCSVFLSAACLACSQNELLIWHE